MAIDPTRLSDLRRRAEAFTSEPFLASAAEKTMRSLAEDVLDLLAALEAAEKERDLQASLIRQLERLLVCYCTGQPGKARATVDRIEALKKRLGKGEGR